MVRAWCLVIAVCVLGVVGTGLAQERIGIFGDTRGCPCEVTDKEHVGLLSITVLHVNSPGARGSQFSAPKPACFNVTYLSDTSAFPATFGNSQTGVGIGYGECLSGTFQILTINFFVSGLTPECCYYRVRPDPNLPSGEIEVVDCNNQLLFVPESLEIINSNPTCLCTLGPIICYPVAVEFSTWGQIKALYE